MKNLIILNKKQQLLKLISKVKNKQNKKMKKDGSYITRNVTTKIFSKIGICLQWVIADIMTCVCTSRIKIQGRVL